MRISFTRPSRYSAEIVGSTPFSSSEVVFMLSHGLAYLDFVGRLIIDKNTGKAVGRFQDIIDEGFVKDDFFFEGEQ